MSDTHVNSYECLVYIIENHSVHEFSAEVQTCGWRGYCTFVLGENGLEFFRVPFVRILLYPFWYRSLSESKKRRLEFVVWPVIKKTQSSSSGSGVVYHFGDHTLVFTEIQFVPYADFSCRLDNHIPQFLLLVQLAQQEHHNVRTGLFLFSEKFGREYLGIVEYESVSFSEVLYDIFESAMLYFPAVLMKNKKFTFVSPLNLAVYFRHKFGSYFLFGEIEIEL